MRVRTYLKLFIITICYLLLFPATTYAAKMVNLRYQPDNLSANSSLSPSLIKPLASSAGNEQSQNKIELKQLKKEIDSQGITHIRLQQFYKGIPVWGSEITRHIPAGARAASKSQPYANGVIFQDLSGDLPLAPPMQAQMSASEEYALQAYKNKIGKEAIPLKRESQLVVYIDDNQKAHWAVHVEFYFSNNHQMPENPHYLIDPTHFEIYKQWDGINYLDNVKGGGLGGNPLLGMNIYDGLPNNKPALEMSRDNLTATCYLENNYVVIKDGRTVENNDPDTAKTISFKCDQLDSTHGNIYWNGALDQVNDAWSPANDALYLVDKVNSMYEEWFHIPILVESDNSNKRMKVNLRVHDSIIPKGGLNLPIPGTGNATWNGVRHEIMFGDNTGFWGNRDQYPLVIPGVMAHELSHGFTRQHSNLFPLGEPGALNESFSDMADAAFDYYLTGHNTWMVAAGLNKDGTGLRYMDNPTQDGYSLDNAKDFYDRKNGVLGEDKKYVDPHEGSGIFNKAFYLLSQPKEKGGIGNTKLAFEIMVQANRYYWASGYLTFSEAACGVWDAANDLNQDTNIITQVMAQVGLDTNQCHPNLNSDNCWLWGLWC